MPTEFDAIINDYIENNIGISNQFLSIELAFQLKQNLLKLFADKRLKIAGIGNEIIQNQDKKIRNDLIYWLDKSHDNKFENDFFDVMDAFILHLNTTCYTGITSYEFHYTMYAAGSFYRKHIDQFKNNNSRQFSMIIYLNDKWEKGDGGELCVYQNETTQTISPNNCKAVFFKSSELEHEVLETLVPRLSITGWLKRD